MVLVVAAAVAAAVGPVELVVVATAAVLAGKPCPGANPLGGA